MKAIILVLDGDNKAVSIVGDSDRASACSGLTKGEALEQVASFLYTGAAQYPANRDTPRGGAYGASPFVARNATETRQACNFADGILSKARASAIDTMMQQERDARSVLAAIQGRDNG